MSLEIHEEQPSRSIRVGNDGAAQTRRYWMKNYTESEQAWLALREYSPAEVYIGGFQLLRSSVEVTIEHSDPEQTLYRGVVEYLSPTAGGATDKAGKRGGGGSSDTDLPINGEGGRQQDDQSDGIEEEDPAKIFFTFGSKQIKLTSVIEGNRQDRWLIKEDGTSQYEAGYRDINKDGDDVAPEGVSIPDATMFMHVRHIRSAESMTPEYYRFLRASLYSVNSEYFAYFNKGQVQFQGAELTPMKSGDYKVEYKFEIGDNTVVRQTFYQDPKKKIVLESSGNMIDEIGGWSPFNYTWLSYNIIGRDTKVGGVGQTDTDTFVRKLDSVNNAQVFSTMDFSLRKNDVVFGQMNIAAQKLDKNWG